MREIRVKCVSGAIAPLGKWGLDRDCAISGGKMKPLKYVNLSRFAKSSHWIWLVLSKFPSVILGTIVLMFGTIAPTAAQYRPGDPGFFEQGEDVLDREIERLRQSPEPEDLLTIEETDSDWVRVTSTEGRFTVFVPGTPSQQPEPEIWVTEAARLNSVGFTWQTDEVWFLVAYADYPTEIDLDAPQVLLEQVGAAIAAKLGNRDRQEREIVLNDYPAREIRFQSPTEISTFRLYLVHRRLYILGAQQSSLNPTLDDTSRFFNSFQVMEP
ncbi:MAG TPA: hypothetical protein IGS17_01590 [Oscillatoriales cyanobacterium M59_W2019_021]|nr:hypothetical protein [Oscillatoriales cyanobacterium M4454_W2019_049]HIK49608.1 hypothetical protein [Oscillatoriales cyanobacterium M59_W2019_021]